MPVKKSIQRLFVISPLVFSFFSAFSQDRPNRPPLPEVALQSANHGEAAIAALAEKLPAVARHYGLDPRELIMHFRKDADLWTDTQGRLFFADSHTPDDNLALNAVDPVTVRRGFDRNHTPEDELSLNAVGTLSTTQALVPLDETFKLHSRPSAVRKIYLDFNGHTTSGTSWRNYKTRSSTFTTPAFDFNGNTASFSTSELERIQYIWQRVAEDYAPFNVDVTTEYPGLEGLRKTSSTDNAFGIRVCIGGSSTDWYSSSSLGGVAYVGSFDWSSDTPCFVFENNLGNGSEKYVAEAISHEVGHTLDLYHDGTSATSYYKGHGTGTDAWAPIMGVGYYKTVVQFSKGEYGDANNTEDDLAKITASYNIPYVSDDFGNTISSAATLSGPSFTVDGLIGRTTDVDVFRFEAAAGTFTFAVTVDSRSPNLNVTLTLMNSTGGTITTTNPTNSLGATLTRSGMKSGTYYLKVDGKGAGSASTTGYSEYGSIGSYTLSGTVPVTAGLAAVALANPINGPDPLSVEFSGIDSGGSIASYEWTFGDGESSRELHPVHTYRQPGTYTATLRVVDHSGLAHADSRTIIVEGPPKVPARLIAIPARNVADPNFAALRLAWFDNSNDDETYFRLQWSTDGVNWPPNEGSGEFTTTSQGYNHGWLDFGATRFYRVRAENSFGVSPWSAVSTGTTRFLRTREGAFKDSSFSALR